MLRRSSLLAAAVLAAGCEPGQTAKVDTVSVPGSENVPMVATPAADSASSANAGAREKQVAPTERNPTPAAPAAPKPSSAPTTQSSTPAKRQDSVLGYDRLIRRPVRTLPPATPTPPG